MRDRVDFDDAFQVVAAGGRLYFGSSIDDKVYALSADTGEEAWSFCTGGPIRLAPMVWNGRVFVGSDDGFVYCLNARDRPTPVEGARRSGRRATARQWQDDLALAHPHRRACR